MRPAVSFHVRLNGQELDTEKAEWRIPAERMKMREEHVVPLSDQAVTLLKELHAYFNGWERSTYSPTIAVPRPV
ncbi:MAG: tyrosine-type recombinase/integrase [Gammaproteobacteria bacterium]|nr:tyrosine-type recombinase/integrase [Gammaproteobacteria bacterium]